MPSPARPTRTRCAAGSRSRGLRLTVSDSSHATISGAPQIERSTDFSSPKYWNARYTSDLKQEKIREEPYCNDWYQNYEQALSLDSPCR